MSDQVTIATFTTATEAKLAGSALEANGVSCVVLDDSVVGVDPLHSIAYGGVKVAVSAWDADTAREILGTGKPALPRPTISLAWIARFFSPMACFFGVILVIRAPLAAAGWCLFAGGFVVWLWARSRTRPAD